MPALNLYIFLKGNLISSLRSFPFSNPTISKRLGSGKFCAKPNFPIMVTWLCCHFLKCQGNKYSERPFSSDVRGFHTYRVFWIAFQGHVKMAQKLRIEVQGYHYSVIGSGVWHISRYLPCRGKIHRLGRNWARALILYVRSGKAVSYKGACSPTINVKYIWLRSAKNEFIASPKWRSKVFSYFGQKSA